MRSLESEKETIEKICDILTVETLEPAKEQANTIVTEAKAKAEEMVHEGHKEKEKLIKEADDSIRERESIFRSTIAQSTSQTLESLRQTIQKELFDSKLTELLDAELKKPQVIADLIKAMIGAIEKEGLSLDLEAFVPKAVKSEEINKLLGNEVLKSLKGEGVKLGEMPSGTQVKLVGKELTIDMSLSAVKEVVSSFVRKDLRAMIFGTDA